MMKTPSDTSSCLPLACWAAALLIVVGACAPMPSQLPTSSDVQQSDALPIDGMWIISSNDKRLRLSNGRAVAVEGWLHLGMVEIKPDEVVIQNLRQSSSQRYDGYDLVLQGRWQGDLQPDGSVAVTVSTSLGPIRYTLHREWVDDPEAFDRARN